MDSDLKLLGFPVQLLFTHQYVEQTGIKTKIRTVLKLEMLEALIFSLFAFRVFVLPHFMARVTGAVKTTLPRFLGVVLTTYLEF